MQAERQRPKGFIISPFGQSVPIKRIPKPAKKRFNIEIILSPVYDFFTECIQSAGGISRLFFQNALSVGIALCCIWAFFSNFTFATAIYQDGNFVTFSADSESYFRAKKDSYALAFSKGITDYTPDFKAVPTLTLRKNIKSGNALRDELLLCSPDIIPGCTVYSENFPVFTAKDKKTATAVVEKYISECRINDGAHISTNIEYKEEIIAKKDVSPFEECSALLKNSNVVKVTSIVNETNSLDIPFETQTKQDSTLFIGESVTEIEGKPGQTRIESETTYENGAVRASRVLSENIVASPVSRVVRVGTKPKDVLKTGLYYPLQGVISSPYGERWGKTHEGIDIAVAEGTPVLAAECGKVIFSGQSETYGKLIRIDHGYGVITAYAHLNELSVATGQSVNKNTQIGLSGNTGRSTGPHLHFEIVKDNIPLDPGLHLKKR